MNAGSSTRIMRYLPGASEQALILTIPFTGVPISVRRSTPVFYNKGFISTALLAYSHFFAIMQIMSQQQNDRIQRAGKLIMLEWLVPLFVQKRTTDFFLPQIDTVWFTKLGIQWGVWRMPEPAYSKLKRSGKAGATGTASKKTPSTGLKHHPLLPVCILENYIKLTSCVTTSTMNACLIYVRAKICYYQHYAKR